MTSRILGTLVVILILGSGCSAEKSAEKPETPVSSIVKAIRHAIPEVPEMSWEMTRDFNLPLNNPAIVPPAKADFLRAEDVVLGVLLGNKARAYPWSMLANFHAVNDKLDGQPILVNLCEACNGGAAFLADIGDGNVLDFRPAGLKNGTWYAIDFQTQSLWYPFVGEAFDGPLKGTKLERIRVYFSTWRDWVNEHPQTTVALSSDEVRYRPHGRYSMMAAKSTFNPEIMKRIASSTPNPNRNLLNGYDLVFGLIPTTDSRAKAYTLKQIKDSNSLIQTRIDDTPVVLMVQHDFQIGAYNRKFEGTELNFSMLSQDPFLMTDEMGNIWNIWGRTTAGPAHPAELRIVDGYLAKWYEWIENFPDTELEVQPLVPAN